MQRTQMFPNIYLPFYYLPFFPFEFYPYGKEQAGMPLMIYGSLATCACCITLGTQISVQWGPYWLTPLFIYMYCLTYLCGAGTVPYVVVAEVFLPEVRSYLTVTAMEWGYICSFTILFIFNPFVTSFGLGPVFYLFAVICFLSAVVSAVFLPETKGLTVDVIQTKFEMQW